MFFKNPDFVTILALKEKKKMGYKSSRQFMAKAKATRDLRYRCLKLRDP